LKADVFGLPRIVADGSTVYASAVVKGLGAHAEM